MRGFFYGGIGQKYSGILPVDTQHCRPSSIVFKTAEPTSTCGEMACTMALPAQCQNSTMVRNTEMSLNRNNI
jgi:hypothetical protein